MNSQILLPVILIISGFGLIVVEVLIMPGLITGLIGFFLLLWGIFLSYQSFGSVGASVSIFSSMFLGAVLLYTLFKLKLWRRFVLKESVGNSGSAVGSNSKLNDLVGKSGIAHTFLRPSGQIIIDGKKYDAMTKGDFVDKGLAVTVVDLSTSQLVVEKQK